MPATLEQAIAAARGVDKKNEWLSLEPSQQTSAIYREMRRIDMEEAGQTDTTESEPRDGKRTQMRADSDAIPQPRCSAMLKHRRSDQCSWLATVKRKGAWYCGLHDPCAAARATRKAEAATQEHTKQEYPRELRVITG